MVISSRGHLLHFFFGEIFFLMNLALTRSRHLFVQLNGSLLIFSSFYYCIFVVAGFIKMMMIQFPKTKQRNERENAHTKIFFSLDRSLARNVPFPKKQI
jgi:hypothetical protein